MRIHPASLLLILLGPSALDAFVFNSPSAAGHWSASQQHAAGFWYRPKPTRVSATLVYTAADNAERNNVPSDRDSNDMDDLSKTVEKLKEDAAEASILAVSMAELRVEAIQKSMKKAKEELEVKSSMLKQDQDNWEHEKDEFEVRIAEVSEAMQQKVSATETATELIKQKAKERQEELEGEIASLSDSLERALTILEEERRGAENVKARMLQVEDALEFEQMKFKKEKEQLGKKIAEEKTRLRQVERGFKEEQQRFNQEKIELKSRITQESSRLAKLQTQMELEQLQFRKERRGLEQQVGVQTSKVTEMKQSLQGAQSRSLADKKDLEQMIKNEQSKLFQATKQLEAEMQRAEKEKAEMQTKITQEKRKLSEMTDTLAREQKRFLEEKSELQKKIDDDKSRIAIVEAELESERNRFAREKVALEERIAEGIRERKQEAKHMKEQYEKIRDGMTAALVSEKENNRKEKIEMKTMYEGMVSERDKKITGLEDDLISAFEAIKKADKLLKELTEEQNTSLDLNQKLEKELLDTISERNGVITGLSNDVTQLQIDVAERDKLIEEYEASFRKMLVLSAKLAVSRIRRIGSRLRNLVRRKKKDKKNGDKKQGTKQKDETQKDETQKDEKKNDDGDS